VTRPRNPRVLIVGYYGFGNIGDEAILAATVEGLRRFRPGLGLTVVSGDPVRTSREHAVSAVDWHDPLRIARAARNADLVLIGGGGLFHDYWGVDRDVLLTRRSWWIPHFAAPALVGALAGRPLMLYGVGVGPLDSADGRALTAAVAGLASAITVRDPASASILEALGIDPTRIEVTADPAFLLTPPAAASAHDFGRARPSIVVCLRPWAVGVDASEWEPRVSAALDLFVEARDGEIVFLPFQSAPGAREDDRSVAERVRRRMGQKDRARIAEPPASARAALAMISEADAVLGMRLHALIFAFSAGIPCVSIGYDPKIDAWMEAAGGTSRPFPVASLDPPRIARALGGALDAGRGHPADSPLGRLRARAERNVAAALSLLEAGPSRPADPAVFPFILDMVRNGLRENDAAQRELVALRAASRAHVARLHERIARLGEEHQRSDEARVREIAAAQAEIDAWKGTHALVAADLAAEKENLRTITHSRIWRIVDGYWSLRRFLSRRGRPAPAPVGPAPLPLSPPEELMPESVSEAPPPPETPPEAPPRPPVLPSVPRGRYDLIILSIIDWDFRFQRPQQLATQFARHGHRVFYLSTTRFLAPEQVPYLLEEKAPGVFEVVIRTPRALDIYRGGLDAEDFGVLASSFEALATDFAFGDAVTMVEIPFWTPLADHLRDRYGWPVIYDCMDEWANFPGFGADVLALENSLVDEADVVIASSDRLVEKLSGSATRLVTARNGVDLDHYSAFFGPNDILDGAAHPVVGYYGALASWVDVPLLEKIARRFSNGTVVLAGGHFDVDLASLESLPNVRLLGQRPYDEMPQLLWNFDVCIIPFVVNAITEATNPVKLYEYFYGGKPVVAPPLTEILPFADVCYLADGHDAFLSQIELALAEPPDDPRRARRREIAAANDWRRRYEAIAGATRECFPAVSLVVATHDGLDLTRDCLDSLFQETWPRREIVVVDNGSTDGTASYLRELAGKGLIRAVFNDSNLGFAAANNIGVRASTGEFVILLNNDTVVPPGLIGRLIRHLQRNSWIGLLCPTTNFAGNEAKVEREYADIRELPHAAAARRSAHAGVTFPIRVAAMYCVAMRRSLFDRVGPMDEAYGLGMFEDDDFSMRVRHAGYDVRCADDAYVHHVGQGTFRRLSPEAYDALWNRNREYFERKWGIEWSAHETRPGVSTPISRFRNDSEPG